MPLPPCRKRCTADFAPKTERGIVVTVVPTNSFYMRTMDPAEWAEKHPIRAMLKTGLKIHPNTDDPTFHNTSPMRVWALSFSR